MRRGPLLSSHIARLLQISRPQCLADTAHSTGHAAVIHLIGQGLLQRTLGHARIIQIAEAAAHAWRSLAALSGDATLARGKGRERGLGRLCIARRRLGLGGRGGRVGCGCGSGRFGSRGGIGDRTIGGWFMGIDPNGGAGIRGFGAGKAAVIGKGEEGWGIFGVFVGVGEGPKTGFRIGITGFSYVCSASREGSGGVRRGRAGAGRVISFVEAAWRVL